MSDKPMPRFVRAVLTKTSQNANVSVKELVMYMNADFESYTSSERRLAVICEMVLSEQN